MIQLKIDPEFRDKLPALTDAQFDQLRENILKPNGGGWLHGADREEE